MGIVESGISYRVWASPSPKASLLLVHGLGANQGWWEPSGSFFLTHNYSSYAIDLRRAGSFEAFKGNVINLHGIIKKENPGKKIFAIGESMGALIILIIALSGMNLFDGAICMSPAFKSRARLNIIDYIKIFASLLYDPQRIYRLPLSADMCTHDADCIKLIEADYNKDILSTSKVLFGILLAQVVIRFSRIKLDLPVLFLLAGDDKVVDSKISKNVFGKIRCPDKTLKEYPGMYHSLSVELGKERVFRDILDWVEVRI
jgi:alpha-beta hydrolase superfamily lysophospholipase